MNCMLRSTKKSHPEMRSVFYILKYTIIEELF